MRWSLISPRGGLVPDKEWKKYPLLSVLLSPPSCQCAQQSVLLIHVICSFYRPGLPSSVTSDSSSSLYARSSIDSSNRGDRKGSWIRNFTGLTFVSLADSSSIRSSSIQKRHTSIITPEQCGGGILRASCSFQRFHSTESGPDTRSNQPSRKSQLLQLGFTEEEAARVLSYYASQGLIFNRTNTQAWLELLQMLHVVHAVQVITKHPIILTNRAATAAANAEGVVGWLLSAGVTSEQQAVLLGKYPMLLTVPCATASAVTECLRIRLSWSDSTIFNVLRTFPKLFCVASNTLNARIDWLLSKDVDINIISKKARSQPQLLLRSFSSPVNSIKIRFYTTVMGKDLPEWLPFVSYSLFQNVGPRRLSIQSTAKTSSSASATGSSAAKQLS